MLKQLVKSWNTENYNNLKKKVESFFDFLLTKYQTQYLDLHLTELGEPTS